MTYQTFLNYKKIEGTEHNCYDRDEWEHLSFDHNEDFFHVREESSDGKGEYLFNLSNGAASMLREEDGKIMNTPASEEMLSRLGRMADVCSDDELISTWRRIEGLFLKLYLTTSFPDKIVFVHVG